MQLHYLLIPNRMRVFLQKSKPKPNRNKKKFYSAHLHPLQLCHRLWSPHICCAAVKEGVHVWSDQSGTQVVFSKWPIFMHCLM